MNTVIKDTDGLYYPYIHVRDEAWLKATLLYFPHILRMVPPGFETRDSDFVAGLGQKPGARGEPLLGNYYLRSYATDQAVDRLTLRLLDDIKKHPRFADQFSRTATQAAYSGRDYDFLIHRSKAPDAFWEELSGRGLMWPPFPNDRSMREHWPIYAISGYREWAAVHPILGEAFMATVAAAAAQDQGLEVVTDTARVHAIASSRDEEAIYQTLIHGRSRTGASEPEMTLRLAHLVIVGGFDVSTLSPEDLAAMSRNREALFDFRRHLAERVAEIPEMGSEATREAHLTAAAVDALDEWRKSLANMSSFARRFFGLGLLDKSEKTMTDLAKALVPGSLTTAVTAAGTAAAASAAGAGALAASPIVIAAAPGLAVALAIYGIKTWRGLRQEETSGPLRYLSLLKKQGATLLVAAPPQSGDASATVLSALAPAGGYQS
jgi:hypothetical protein